MHQNNVALFTESYLNFDTSQRSLHFMLRNKRMRSARQIHIS